MCFVNHANRKRSWVGRILVNFILATARDKDTDIRQPMLKLKTHSGFHDLFLKYNNSDSYIYSDFKNRYLFRLTSSSS
jgi:hypothetical protein